MLGDNLHCLELRLDDELVGAALTLTDSVRLHFWACGYTVTHDTSTFYLGFHHIMRHAFDLGKQRIELDRRNPEFKRRRYRLTPAHPHRMERPRVTRDRRRS